MKLNEKLVEMLLRGSDNFEVVGQLDMYGNGTIIEVDSCLRIYSIKSNYQGTSTQNIIIADNVKKEINKLITILQHKGYDCCDEL